MITPAMWSANYIVARAAPETIGPHLLAFSRWSLALCLMLPVAIPELYRKWPLWSREWRSFLMLGALGMWICGAFVYIGGHTTEALNIGLLYALAPVLIAVASALLFDDRLRGLQIVGLVLSLVGMLIIVIKGSLGNLVSVNFTRGDLWIMTAVLSWTLYSILLRMWPSSLSTFSVVAIYIDRACNNWCTTRRCPSLGTNTGGGNIAGFWRLSGLFFFTAGARGLKSRSGVVCKSALHGTYCVVAAGRTTTLVSCGWSLSDFARYVYGNAQA